MMGGYIDKFKIISNIKDKLIQGSKVAMIESDLAMEKRFKDKLAQEVIINEQLHYESKFVFKGQRYNLTVRLNSDPELSRFQKLMIDTIFIKKNLDGNWKMAEELANKFNSSNLQFVKEGDYIIYKFQFVNSTVKYLLKHDKNLIGAGQGHYVLSFPKDGLVITYVFTTTKKEGCIFVSHTDIEGASNDQYLNGSPFINLPNFAKRIEPIEGKLASNFLDDNEEFIEDLIKNTDIKNVKNFFSYLSKTEAEVSERRMLHTITKDSKCVKMAEEIKKSKISLGEGNDLISNVFKQITKQ